MMVFDNVVVVVFVYSGGLFEVCEVVWIELVFWGLDCYEGMFV